MAGTSRRQRQSSSKSAATAILFVFLILGDHTASAWRQTRMFNDKAPIVAGSSFAEANASTGICRDPLRYKRDCAKWKDLCPTKTKKQPPPLDKFMENWCPATCGQCEMDGSEEDDGNKVVGEELHSFDDQGKPRCTRSTISRRRSGGDSTCACRRRSGTSGLPVGWQCGKDNWIEWKEETPEPSNTVCCCKAGPCSMQALARGDVVEHREPKSKEQAGQIGDDEDDDGDVASDDDEEEGLEEEDSEPDDEDESEVMCCKLKAPGTFGGCPYNTGYKMLQDSEDMCKPKTVTSTIAGCRAVLVKWQQEKEWYKALERWETAEELYQDYIPCLVPADMHVFTFMLDRSFTGKTGLAANPIRHFVITRPECTDLTDNELQLAAVEAYDTICPFGLPSRNYKPDLNSENTCGYDSVDKTITLQKSRSCPEGHRCACPVFDKMAAVGDSMGGGKSAYNAANGLSKGVMYVGSGSLALVGAAAQGGQAAAVMAYTAGVLGMQVSALTKVLTTTGLVIPTYAWPLMIGSGVVALLAFGASYVAQWARHTCEKKVGCYPLDCVEEPDRGCRIRSPENLRDEGNPFWFLPPPTYKCSYKGGKCMINPCSKSNLFEHRVGIFQTLSWRREGKSQVYNCQPMLQEDMEPKQLVELEKRTHDLKQEYETDARRLARMQDKFQKACPWMTPSPNNILRCGDGTTCHASRKHQDCCKRKGGTLRCPENFPIMCNDGFCAEPDSHCEENGGRKPCPVAEGCPWLLPSVRSWHAQCQDGNFSRLSWKKFWKKKVPCSKKGGILRCAFKKPIMCDDGTCQTNCDKYGGPKLCTFPDGTKVRSLMLAGNETSS